ncbi:MAG TPA: energy-coupling factor transporter transmembrane component T [Anaerovoracaceae bacterium]|nr:energy-coupling factor transporter transmembrane component T [Anaerovoracaceae bacterium]
MIRDITLGQYYPSKSIIHGLDARTKIIATILFIVELFIVNNFYGFLLAAISIGMIIVISKVPVRFIFKGLKPVFIIIIFTFIINVLMIDGRVLFSFSIFTITYEGLYRAFFMAARLMLLIIGSSLLTLTTKPLSLTDGIEKLLRPFEIIKVPSHEIAMMMTIALRFIPTLLEETDKIMKAQQARGADFETGGIIKRAKNLIPILVPLFISAFRIAQDLAMAMEARCYRGGKGRTRMNEIKYTRRDVIAAIVLVVFLFLMIGTRYI